MLQTEKKFFLIKDRVEIYKDFTINLLNYIIDYYLDEKTLSHDVDIKNHFNWCFNKVCDEFKLEDIDFSDNKKLKTYFFDFYYHQFYKRNILNTIEVNSPLKYYDKIWRSVFEIDKQRNKNDIKVLIEIYVIFDFTIHEKNNVKILD
jgi:hypothetical protein